MITIAGKMGFPDGREITYTGKIHHRSISSLADTHEFSGNTKGISLPDFNSGHTQGPEFIRMMLEGFAVNHGASIVIEDDDGPLESFPDLDRVCF